MPLPLSASHHISFRDSCPISLHGSPGVREEMKWTISRHERENAKVARTPYQTVLAAHVLGETWSRQQGQARARKSERACAWRQDLWMSCLHHTSFVTPSRARP